MVPGPPASVTGPEGRVKEPATPGQGVAALMGSSLNSMSQGSETGLSRSGTCQDGLQGQQLLTR